MVYNHYLYYVLHRLRLKDFDPGLGSGSQLIEPRLRLGVFGPTDNITDNSKTIRTYSFI
jgi:hypothetical protein